MSKVVLIVLTLGNSAWNFVVMRLYKLTPQV